MPELNLQMSLQPKQDMLLDLCEHSRATVIGFGGPRGGGKSGAARRIALLRRLNHPGTKGLIFRRVYKDLKDNHIEPFFREFPQLFQFYRATDHELILPSNKGPSRLQFGFAENISDVRRSFHGPEYMDVFIDQAEQLTEEELKLIKTACRWPGQEGNCRQVLFFNPGGPGLPYLKRIFGEKKHFKENENPDDYAYIQACGWDNVEWVRPSLEADGLTQEDFYSWDKDRRFDYFVARSQYGRDLASLPPAMRVGHLLGSLDSFKGQYFDIWNPAKQVVDKAELVIEPWFPKWISIDWGFEHPAAVYWHAQDGGLTKTYREWMTPGQKQVGPRELAQGIIERCGLDREREKIDAVYLSPDAFAKRTTEDSIADQIGQVLRQNRLPFPRVADDDRKGGWLLMREMLRFGEWVISSQCTDLIGTIPLLSTADDKPDDCVKFNGDDSVDSARYGIKSRFPGKQPPREVQLAAAMRKIEETVGVDEARINTMKHLEHLKFDQNWKKTHKPVRKTRNWRGNA